MHGNYIHWLSDLLKTISHYMLLVFFVTQESTLKVQFQPGNWRRIPLCCRRRPTRFQIWLHFTPRTICLHATYHYTKLGHMFVMNNWNVDIEQRQMYLAWVKSSDIMSVWHSLSYLLASIMLLSLDRVTMICIVKFRLNKCIVKFRLNNIDFTLTGVLKATPLT